MRKVLVAVLILLTVGVSSAASAGGTRAGTLTTAKAGPIDYTVYLPYGYGARKNAKLRYPALYLLHGRGDTMRAWTQIKADLDKLIDDGTIAPVIAVLPDAPWSERGSWYVDSAYEGGSAVETMLTGDLVSHVDTTYRTAAHRGARLIGGYSMGGYGALRYALAHQDLFANALVLSPAVYNPLPPADSSAREYGGFGQGGERFVDEVYQRLTYPALLPALDADLPVRMFIAVGDDEWANPDPADARHDLDYEAATLYNNVRRSDAVAAQFRVLDGGHDWDVWRPAFVAGLTELSSTLSATPPTGIPGPLRGTPGTDWAGGVTPGGTVAFSASGPVDGQPYAGGLDAVVQAPQWTKQLGTPSNDRLYGAVSTADGGVIVAGYTRGDLDGEHPGSPADDGFVARFTATGELAWLTQLGDATKADRFYGLTAAPDGGVYVAGYTSGALAGPSAGDKDVILARIGPDGTVAWTRQLGGAGEDKGYAVAADAGGAYVAGVTSAGLPGAPYLGGTDGFVAAFTVDGAPRWVKADGDLFGGVAVTTAGVVVATGAAGGDALTTAYTSGGAQRWRTVSGGRGDDAGAEVVALPGGAVAVVGFTGSTFGVPAGGADVFALRLDGRGRQQSAAQLGTARDDGVDEFGEENLYAVRSGDRLLVTGLTSGDVFLTEVTP
ncbi:alpha/beta hydrolase-fold protein [Phytohabitans sp. ZYX-F-186]|uniref:Alpha/beta hydrolase-fold protein n=1 Tax=Phytohabitans maris TaxID=3071409 RepID=A0ABU0ZU27_9ACTN|nr:alpha/beta hydrolase-fold protein [Phytohabitans sp. ZYX-F-186]MDQ7909819.1 alpha/beta hydrolase-fold protein [Phytohabitans sp. ZYX-F-186]